MVSSSSIYRIGRYTLHQEFASGGMGTVHFGLVHAQGGFCRVVAIKALRANEEEEASRKIMMLDEARLAGRIRHPNVVPVLDVVAEKDRLYLVMEYVHGEPLSRLQSRAWSRDQAVPQDILVAVLVDALRGLHAAHEAVDRDGAPLGLVHRDVSPQNILVGQDGFSRVVDFGVAKAKGRLQATTQGDVKGKIAYMAPEQIRGVEVDRRADVYAAGIILWEGIAGRKMYEGLDEPALLGRVLFDRVDPPSTVSGKQEPLDAVVMRALAIPVEERFATALEMAEALTCVVPPAPATRVSAWVEDLFREEMAEREAILRDLEAQAERVSLVPASSAGLDALAEFSGSACRPSEPTVAGVPATRAVDSARPGRKRWVLPVAFVIGLVAFGAAIAFGTAGPFPADGGEEVPPPASTALQWEAGMAVADVVSAKSSAPVPSMGPPHAVASSLPLPRAYSPPGKPQSSAKPESSAKPAATLDCDPPYTFDAQGNRKYKIECL
jgi:serine/threonine-protein kinase